MVEGHPVRIPRKPQEIHPRHEDGVRRYQEAPGKGRPYRLPRTSYEVKPLHIAKLTFRTE